MYKKGGTINNHTTTVGINQFCPRQNMMHVYTHTHHRLYILMGVCAKPFYFQLVLLRSRIGTC